jgi:hypothetical protein
MRGSAIIITLSVLVLIVAILLAFFTQSTISRQISFSSASRYRADTIAHTALDTITGDLRSEMIAGSTVYTSGSITLYLPIANLPVANATMQPCRVVDQGFQNLVKQSSAAKPFWTGSNYTGSLITSPVRAAIGNNTKTPSANGRYIKVNQWNRPGLLGDPGTSSNPDIPAAYEPPDWIVVTRQGAITDVASMPSLAVLADKTGTNSNYAVGRFAYTIYDESGVLDVNVTGYPSSLSNSTFTKERGLLPQVGLENIPGVLDAYALVQWRNQTTGASAGSYTNAVQTATNGFITVAPGDQAFISRKDLIHYIQDNPTQVQTAALPYLGTFTRDSDAPSYFPDPNRPTVSGTDDIINPNVLKIRVQTPFTRPDGTTAEVGEPLLKHRFPLTRLALLQNPTANAALIKTYFAMQQRPDGMWDYVDPDTGATATTLPTIKTLNQVASVNPGREPTYWELLQAGILVGSLGATGPANSYVTTTQDSSTTRQILTIGLCIIDQYDTDDTPTVLHLGGTLASNTMDQSIAGVENVPYIMWIAQQHFRDTISQLYPKTLKYIDGYLMFAMWNPHRNASSANTGQYRIEVSGSSYIIVQNGAILPLHELTSDTLYHTSTKLAFQTSSTRNFSQIAGLLPTDAVLGSSTDFAKFPYPSTGTTVEVGVLMGQVQLPSTPDFPTLTTGTNYLNTYLVNKPNITMVLEKQVGSNWIPYQIIPHYTADYNNDGDSFPDVTSALNQPNGFTAAVLAYAYADPRTSRFGLTICNGGNVGRSMMANNFNIIDNSTGIPFLYKIPSPSSNTFFKLADYAYNTASSSHYVDPDGTIRKGDSNPLTTGSHGIYSPFDDTADKIDARPIVLNRPFTSVAEMGYAFRDDPWRTLNFSSKDSADSGLLDLFCLNENKNPLRAGVLNLNSASQEVLTAILINAYRDPSSTDLTPLASVDAATIAQAMKTQLGPASNPLLVIKSAADLPVLADAVASSLPDQFKFKREAFCRSFADIINGRTWNLMIDVVAQSGRYRSPTPASLNDFVVEGEQRYWLHVAIDRYTGEVISKSLETVQVK